MPEPRGRRLLVSGVDLGDGKRVDAWFTVGFSKVDGRYYRFVSVRQYRKHRVWSLPLNAAAGAIARLAQARMANAKLGTAR